MSNIKISEMAEAESLNDNDLLTIVQSGVNKKITKQNAIGDIIQAINNPTYTTTEGTDLSINNTRVGKMKFKYYGDTEQENYNNKNLFDKNNPNILNNCVTGSGLTLDSLEGCKTLYVPCKPNLTYTITKIASTRFIVVTTTNTPAIGVSTSARSIDLTGTSITITAGATANYICVFYYYSGADTLPEQDILNSIQIKIDTPLPNPDYPIEVQTVTGENTIDIVGRNICPDTFSKYTVFSPYTQYNLPIKVGTECIMSFTDNDTSIDISGCYIGFKDSGTGAPTSIRWCINNGTVLSNTTNIPSTGTDWCGTICIYPNTEEAFNKLFGRYKIQVEIGNTISNYMSYKESQSYELNLGSLELCKIVGYQDYLYNNGGKWFKHKEVKKQVFNGSETWTTRTVSVGTLYETNVTGFYSTTTQTLGFCNQYKAEINIRNNYEFRILSGIVLALHNDDIGSVSNLTTFLASNNMVVYYPLATPIEEEITEPTLINQLNEIKYGAESYYGTTNIMITSEELQPTLKVQTLDKIGV